MKKLSLLIALILCVTIGGVYANWIYAGTNAETLHHHISNMGLTDPSTSTVYGEYDVLTGDDTIKIKFDQKNQTVGSFDYTASLIFIGEMKVTFTPNAAFDGVPTAVFKLTSEKDLSTFTFDDTLYGATDGKVGSQAIFKKYDTTTEVALTFVKNEVKGVYEAVIKASDLASLIEINTIVLDTKAGYDAFAQVLGTIGKIGIEVVDKTVPNVASANV